MNERYKHYYKGKGILIGLGALVLIGLCLMLCFGAAAFTMMQRGPAYGTMPYVQPPVGEEGGVAPPVYHGPGFFGGGRHGGFGPFGLFFFGVGMFFKLLFFGLVLFLLIGLVKRFCFGWHWCPPYWGKPPQGEEGEDQPHFVRGPWAWHHRHHRHWGPFPWCEPGPEPESGDEEAEGEPNSEPNNEPDAAAE